MLLTCFSLLVSGGWLASRRSGPVAEFVAGLLIVLGLVLLGYLLHQTMDV